jgi:calcium-dependent protein kinase
MLLSSSVPFYGKSREDIAHKILGNQWAFKPKSRWRKISSQATQLIKDLLVMNPDNRLDAESALGSAWLNPQITTTGTTALDEEDLAISSILRYATYPQLKKLVSFRNISTFLNHFGHQNTQKELPTHPLQ